MQANLYIFTEMPIKIRIWELFLFYDLSLNKKEQPLAVLSIFIYN